jgi:o-succinylbenzoate---CoA ligase
MARHDGRREAPPATRNRQTGDGPSRVTNDLAALDLPAGPGFVDALTRIWDRGDAALPLDQRLPASAKASQLAALAVAVVRDADGTEHRLTGSRPVEDGDALVVATSGSTGAPKGVVLTHAAVAASARASSERLAVTSDDHWLACLPLSHVGGLAVVTRALLTGTPVTVLPGFDPAAVQSSAATLVSLVATTLRRIDPTRFRVIVLGGAAAPDDLPTNTVTTYGMTETGSGIVYDGVPLDGVEVRLAEDGEIVVSSPMLLRAYRRADSDVDPRASGWLATGDLGRWLPDGRLAVDGRRGDLIISGGENVWPEPVERAIRRDPRVADVAVAGTPDPEWGHVVTAYVVPSGTEAPSLDDLRRAVREVLPAFCAPRMLELVESIPTTPLGKPQRSALRPAATPS